MTCGDACYEMNAVPITNAFGTMSLARRSASSFVLHLFPFPFFYFCLVIRDVVKEIAADLGIPCEEHKLSATELCGADEVFLGTMGEVRTRMDETMIPELLT